MESYCLFIHKQWNKVKWALGSITMNKASGGVGIPVEIIQILKGDAVKVLHSICQQIWKTQQWSWDWKGVFIPIPKKAMPKNAHKNAQLHSSHTLVKYCSKFSKLGFNSMWAMNFQKFKLDLGKAEEPDIKLPTSAGSWKKQESSRKTSISTLLTMPKPLTVWITTVKIFQEMGIPDQLTCLWRNLYAGQEVTIRTGLGTTDCFQIGKEVPQGCICHPAYLTYM